MKLASQFSHVFLPVGPAGALSGTPGVVQGVLICGGMYIGREVEDFVPLCGVTGGLELGPEGMLEAGPDLGINSLVGLSLSSVGAYR